MNAWHCGASWVSAYAEYKPLGIVCTCVGHHGCAPKIGGGGDIFLIEVVCFIPGKVNTPEEKKINDEFPSRAVHPLTDFQPERGTSSSIFFCSLIPTSPAVHVASAGASAAVFHSAALQFGSSIAAWEWGCRRRVVHSWPNTPKRRPHWHSAAPTRVRMKLIFITLRLRPEMIMG